MNETARTLVIVVGCAGRMGRAIVQLINQSRDLGLATGVDVAGSGFPTDLDAVISSGDVVVDFSASGPAAANARTAMASRKPFVTGVTGFSESELAGLRECGRTIPVVHAPNFSVGVCVLTRLAAEAATLLGPDYDIEIAETHHRMKKDAPSGTARQLLDTLRTATGRSEVVHGREGMVGQKPVNQIGVNSIRSGDVVGEHTVVFGGPGERLELTHKADSRTTFASGVLAAVRFALKAEPGFYGMADVLGRRHAAPTG